MDNNFDGDTHCNWHAWNGPHRLGKGIWSIGNQSTNQAHPDYGIFLYWLEDWEESEISDKYYCHSDSRETLPSNTGVKHS